MIEPQSKYTPLEQALLFRNHIMRSRFLQSRFSWYCCRLRGGTRRKRPQMKSVRKRGLRRIMLQSHFMEDNCFHEVSLKEAASTQTASKEVSCARLSSGSQGSAASGQELSNPTPSSWARPESVPSRAIQSLIDGRYLCLSMPPDKYCILDVFHVSF